MPLELHPLDCPCADCNRPSEDPLILTIRRNPKRRCKPWLIAAALLLTIILLPIIQGALS